MLGSMFCNQLAVIYDVIKTITHVVCPGDSTEFVGFGAVLVNPGGDGIGELEDVEKVVDEVVSVEVLLVVGGFVVELLVGEDDVDEEDVEEDVEDVDVDVELEVGDVDEDVDVDVLLEAMLEEAVVAEVVEEESVLKKLASYDVELDMVEVDVVEVSVISVVGAAVVMVDEGISELDGAEEGEDVAVVVVVEEVAVVVVEEKVADAADVDAIRIAG
ncbi:hypothetical protein DXG01_000233 [Tephrocybe rancida]|nr:hypothetical protein DXG01_000233 [Tephrocybe rancida]